MMKYPEPRQRDGQTFVFFLVAFTTVFLLCGLGLDSGLYYLAKARLSRATDAAVISGVQNFAKGRDEVADIMRNIAVANYVDLGEISTTPTAITTSTNTLGGISYHYAYMDSDGVFGITNTIATGSQGHITLARTDAVAPYRTYFMSITGIDSVTDLDLAASAEAERRPRLITVILDRSGSMVTSGSKVLPDAVRVFLNSGFDTNADAIAIVSYSSYARLEMPHTNDFITMGEDKMYLADGTSKDGKQTTSHPSGMKFSGVTAADEGMRMGLEIMRTNDGYQNEQYDKYIVFMTDGDFNSVRSLYASPTYTNRIMMSNNIDAGDVSHFGTNLSPYLNRNKGGTQDDNVDNYYYLFPNLTENGEHNEDYQVATKDKAAQPQIFEPEIIRDGVSSQTVDSGTDSGMVKGVINVWLPPGSVAIHRDSVDGIPDSDTNAADNDVIVRNYFSYYTNSAVNIPIMPGEYVDLVLPGYVVDAVSSGYMTINSNGKHNDFNSGNSYWPEFPQGEDPEEYNDYFEPGDIWNKPNADSHYREWMMRNRSNLLWDFVLFKPEDGRWDGQEPYVYPPINAGLYYPGGMFIWSHNNYVSQVSGNYYDGIPRISTNFTMSTPKFAGNTFYSSAGLLETEDDWKINVPSWLTNTFDSVMSVQYNPDPNKDLEFDYPMWRPRTYNGDRTPNTVVADAQVYLMTNQYDYNAATNPITPPLANVGGVDNTTAGWMYDYDINGNRYLRMNSMSFNSRPTYFFDFKDNRWESITDWNSASLMLNTGDWKALRYCDVARSEDVTIYTIKFKNGNEGLLRNMANDSAAGQYDPSEPEGKMYTAYSGDDLEDAFEDISKRIRAVITE